jgi:hypothetical protein
MIGKYGKRTNFDVNETRRNTIDYKYDATGIVIKMRHLVRAKLFALEMDGKISLLDLKRGYKIIKKWKDPGRANKLSTAGDIRDIEIDNILACGGKIIL